MVAINEILLPECTGEECGGDNNICTDSRVHHRNAENRAPVTRNHRSAPILGRWLTRDPIGYQGGINLYGYVNSSPVGNVDAEGLEAPINARPLGSGVSGSSIKLSLQAREYDPTCTYGPVVARLKMHLRFEYNPGGKVPTVTTDSRDNRRSRWRRREMAARRHERFVGAGRLDLGDWLGHPRCGGRLSVFASRGVSCWRRWGGGRIR